MDFHLRRLFAERLQPKFAQIANGTTWYRDISRLPLKPPQYFKPKNVIETGFFVFLWILPKPVRGSQHEENFQKTSLKDKKILRVSAAIFFIFSNLFPVLLDRFVVFISYMLHLEVSQLKTVKY